MIKFIREYSSILVTIIVIILIVFYSGYRYNHVKRNGVIGVARIDRFESAESGVNVYIKIFFGEKIYSTSVDVSCEPGYIGNYYFVKFNKANPESSPILYCDSKIPDCIIQNGGLYKIWREIPNCENFMSKEVLIDYPYPLKLQ